MLDKLTQRNRIIKYLEWNPGATNLDIATALRISSPSERLSELGKLGKVVSVPCSETNADGKKTRFCRYYLPASWQERVDVAEEINQMGGNADAKTIFD